MSYVDAAAPSVDSAPDDGKSRLRAYWREIAAYDKTASDWREQSEKIVKLYLDQHRTQASPRRFALLWSNIETLKPAVYIKTPNILCSRRYKDPDPKGRTAAELLERATNTTFDLYKVDEVFRMVRDDRLLTSRGQAWVRYEASFDKAEDDDGDEYDKLSGEKVCVDYVEWRDFGHNVAGTWKDVWLVWRMVYKNKDEITKRFGKEIADALTFTARVDPEGKQERGEPVSCIYELWDKKLGKTVFLAREHPDLIDDGEPPLSFRSFFPCPEPCYGSKTGKSLIPTPDYRYYQDQAQEIDDLTDKIANLTEFLQVRAFVPAGPSSEGSDAIRLMIQTMQDGMTNNRSCFIPVESWAGFAEKGGASRLIDWLPIDMVIKALQGAIESRNQLIQDVYQITGIADILRGQTDPNETLGAQELKAQTGARRITSTKDEMARFCRDIGQLVAEVIAEQFSPETIAEITGYAYVPAPPIQATPSLMGQPLQAMAMQPSGPQVQQPIQQMQQNMLPLPDSEPASPSGQTFDDSTMALLRNDRMRNFLIDIETDSTIQPDEDAEKQRRTEFITAVGSFMKEAGAILPGAPSLAPMMKESLLFLVRGFRAGRSLEDVIERSMDQLGQQLQQPKPDPEQQKMQAQMQMEQQRLQMEQQSKAMELQFKERELELNTQAKQAELALKQQEAQANIALEQAKAESDARLQQFKIETDARLNEQEMNHKAALDAQQAQQQQALATQDAERKGALEQQDAEMRRTQMIEDMQRQSNEAAAKTDREHSAHTQKMQLAQQSFDFDEGRKKKAFESDQQRRAAQSEVEHGERKRMDAEAAAERKKARTIKVKRDGTGRAVEYEVQ